MERRRGQNPVERRVLALELLQALDLTEVNAIVRRFPVKRLFFHAVFATHISGRPPGCGLAQNLKDVFL